MTDEQFSILCNNPKSNPILYGIKVLGWKRLKGTYIETWTLTQKDLSEIANGLHDAYYEDCERCEYTIEVVSNNTVLSDIPYSLIEKEDPNLLLRHTQDEPTDFQIPQKPSLPFYRDFSA